MSALQSVRGTHDLYGDAMRRHRYVVETARNLAARYGYEEFDPPLIEFVDVFARSMGETSDVVSKEMYVFADRGGDSIALRPEFTAGIMRAVISEGLTHKTPLKFFCQGPLFRYERPQKGRQRQFHQIGLELLGVNSAQGDIEAIAIGFDILKALGVSHEATLELNTLGDSESRQLYRKAIVDYFSHYKNQLSEDSLKRLERNPLRILDSKDEGDKQLVMKAPFYGDFLNPASREFFDEVQAGLNALGISYNLNPRLVRGLDYYTHTVFEFVTNSLGAQGTVLAGGRYDDLSKVMGGPDLPGIGWGAGIERLAMMVKNIPAMARPMAVIPVSDQEQSEALK
ncbi:MAG: histidine--tRNA ligase [Dongiaceae bacterium]